MDCVLDGLMCHLSSEIDAIPCNELYAMANSLADLCQDVCKARQGLNGMSVLAAVEQYNEELQGCLDLQGPNGETLEELCAASQVACLQYPIVWPDGEPPECSNFECTYIDFNEALDPEDDCGCPDDEEEEG